MSETLVEMAKRVCGKRYLCDPCPLVKVWRKSQTSDTKPILFSTPMVRAILDRRKTMTRRVVKDIQNNVYRIDSDDGVIYGAYWGDTINGVHTTYCKEIEVPYRIGDILWVRETWNGLRENKRAGIPAQYWYKADDESMNPDDRWVPSIFMPKEACRLFLRVTDVRVERVQDITDADARAEGCGESDVVYYNGALKCMFFELWDSINAKRGFGWEKNPWVWVYTYERVDKPEGWCA